MCEFVKDVFFARQKWGSSFVHRFAVLFRKGQKRERNVPGNLTVSLTGGSRQWVRIRMANAREHRRSKPMQTESPRAALDLETMVKGDN